MSNLRDGLEETPYGELKNKFIELGIGEAFKPGLKKVILIEKAIELVEKKRRITRWCNLGRNRGCHS